jgi:hypothetical protein
VDGPADGVICYAKDENGKLVKKRIAREDFYTRDENGEVVPYVPPGPRRFTEEDRERCDRTRDLVHTRQWFNQELLKIAEGRVKVSWERYQALITFGRSKGWHQKRSPAKR